MTAGLRPVLAADPVWAKRVKRGFGSGESIIAYVARDPRAESAVSAESPDPRVLVHEGEFAQLLTVAARESSTLSALLRAGWDGQPLENHTRTHGDLEAPEAHLSVLAGVTIEELLQRVTAVDAANGFLNRFLLVSVERTKKLPDPPPIPDALDTRTVKAIQRALKHARQCGADLRRDDEASALWCRAYEDELSVDRYGLAGAVCSRAEAHTLRLSMLYALLDCSPVIRAEHVEAALDFWRYCEQSAIVIFGDDSGDPDLEKLRTALGGAGEAGLTRDQIRSEVFQRHKSQKELDALLQGAEQRRLIVSREEKTPGRSRRRYWLTDHAASADDFEFDQFLNLNEEGASD